MAFDPHRHVTVASGAFSVDVNELNAAHAALTYEKLLAIGPSKAALTCAQLEVDLAPFDTSSVTSAINTALSSLDDLGAAVDDLLWKLRDAALTYDDANSFASLWEAFPAAHPVRSSASSDSPDSRRRVASRACCGAPVSTCVRTPRLDWGSQVWRLWSCRFRRWQPTAGT